MWKCLRLKPLLCPSELYEYSIHICRVKSVSVPLRNVTHHDSTFASIKQRNAEEANAKEIWYWNHFLHFLHVNKEGPGKAPASQPSNLKPPPVLFKRPSGAKNWFSKHFLLPAPHRIIDSPAGPGQSGHRSEADAGSWSKSSTELAANHKGRMGRVWILIHIISLSCSWMRIELWQRKKSTKEGRNSCNSSEWHNKSSPRSGARASYPPLMAKIRPIQMEVVFSPREIVFFT